MELAVGGVCGAGTHQGSYSALASSACRQVFPPRHDADELRPVAHHLNCDVGSRISHEFSLFCGTAFFVVRLARAPSRRIVRLEPCRLAPPCLGSFFLLIQEGATAKTVIGLIDNLGEAQAAVRDLVENGIPQDDVGFVADPGHGLPGTAQLKDSEGAADGGTSSASRPTTRPARIEPPRSRAARRSGHRPARHRMEEAGWKGQLRGLTGFLPPRLHMACLLVGKSVPTSGQPSGRIPSKAPGDRAFRFRTTREPHGQAQSLARAGAVPHRALERRRRATAGAADPDHAQSEAAAMPLAQLLLEAEQLALEMEAVRARWRG